ncbi:redox-regulated ATPase YchF, partial [Candidatus Uhrbacteria bacterium]|nr:redox-regulated ATPase YchF [Candidatus Uhrbacteria bacterium]
VGLPNVGKSTLFKALTKKQVDIANYPFCTIQPNTGVVKVPDNRLDQLSRLNNSAQIIPASIEFVDIAGLVKGAHKGEGLGNQFLSHIREVDAIAHVVRAFVDKDVVHVSGAPDPKGDIETINLELIYADMATVEKRIASVRSQLKSGSDKKIEELLALLEKLKSTLDAGRLASTIELTLEEKKSIRDLSLLTLKPYIFVLNTDESGSVDASLADVIAESTQSATSVTLCAKIESEMAELTPEEIAELGLASTGLDTLIRTAYETLYLITYFTSGPKETRAWTITRGTKAPQAAGEIHTDFEKGFIRAEVINWKDLVDACGELAAKEKGLIRLEGKEYVVQDGDVMVFRFA